MAPIDSEYSEFTSFEVVPLDDLQNPLLRQAVAYWRSVCGTRRFPAREDLDPRELAPLRSHMILIKVLNNGADFEYRFVGEVQLRAYSRPYAGQQLSRPANPSIYSEAFFTGYQYIQQSGNTFAMRGWAGKDFTYSNFVYFETVVLPLGPSDDEVDYIAVFSAYAPRDLTQHTT